MAKKHRANEVRLFGGVRRNRRALMMTTALQATALLVLAVPAAALGHAQPAPNARPMGGQVVVGQASIANTANTTAITQGSQRAAIDWRSFDVGSQHSVTFTQPSSSAIALNRVIGPDPSQIAGRITANGQVALVNQSGVVFYKGSQVNVSTLIV
jgi:filamentous hemagglutinin family protein